MCRHFTYAGEARHCFVAGEDTSPSAPVVAFVPHSDSDGATVGKRSAKSKHAFASENFYIKTRLSPSWTA